MHKETNRFKTYTQLEKTYRKILVRRWPRQHGQPRTEFRRSTIAAAGAAFLRMGKSDPLILLRQDT
jgi:hypothetical protein